MHFKLYLNDGWVLGDVMKVLEALESNANKSNSDERLRDLYLTKDIFDELTENNLLDVRGVQANYKSWRTRRNDRVEKNCIEYQTNIRRDMYLNIDTNKVKGIDIPESFHESVLEFLDRAEDLG